MPLDRPSTLSTVQQDLVKKRIRSGETISSIARLFETKSRRTGNREPVPDDCYFVNRCRTAICSPRFLQDIHISSFGRFRPN